MTPRMPVFVAAVVVSAALALTGCVPEPAVDPSGSPSASDGTPTAPVTDPAPLPSGSAAATTGVTPSPPPTTPSTPSPAPSTPAPSTPGEATRAVLPACGDLLPLSTVHALFSDAAERIEVGGSAADHMPGPLAKRTMRDALQSNMCTWAVPYSDGGFTVITAELTRSARDGLISGLRSAASYTERRLDGAVSFSTETETELGTSTIVYVFQGNVWITVDGTLSLSTAREFASSALDAVRVANA